MRQEFIRQEFISLFVGAENPRNLDVAVSTNLEVTVCPNLNGTAIRPLLALRLCEMTQRLAGWRRQVQSRAELMNLSDRGLQDIGMSRCTADFGASKPFWMA